MYRKKFQRIASTALISAACAAAPVFADSFTWTGGGDNAHWDDTATSGTSITWPNWRDTTIFGSPHLPAGAGDDVRFGSGFASGNPNLNGSRSVRYLTLDTATRFSLVGNAGDTLMLNGGDLSRTSASAGTQIFAVPVTLTLSPEYKGEGTSSRPRRDFLPIRMTPHVNTTNCTASHWRV